MRTRPPFLLSIFAGVALVASACGPSGQPAAGGGASSNGTGASNVSVSTGAPTPAAGASTPAAGGATQPTAQPGATLVPQLTAQATAQSQGNLQPSGTQAVTVNVLQGEPDNLDPNRSSFAPEGAVISRVFEPLLTFDKDLKPVPAAATSFDVSADGKTYTSTCARV